LSDSTNTRDIKITGNPVLRWIFFISGILLTGIGILGMFLPLLPTTVFFILAAWCYARSSQRFYLWIHKNKYFGKYLSDYTQKKGLSIGSKVATLIILWAGILLSVFLSGSQIYVNIILLLIAAGVTWHILAIKTIK